MYLPTLKEPDCRSLILPCGVFHSSVPFVCARVGRGPVCGMDDSNLNPEVEQENERLVLGSIFMDEFTELPPQLIGGHTHRRIQLTIKPQPNQVEENFVEVELVAVLPPSYPVLQPALSLSNATRDASERSEQPGQRQHHESQVSQPRQQRQRRHLTDAELSSLRALLASRSAELAGYTQLMELAELARDFLLQLNTPPPEHTEVSFHEQMLERLKLEEAPQAQTPLTLRCPPP